MTLPGKEALARTEGLRRKQQREAAGKSIDLRAAPARRHNSTLHRLTLCVSSRRRCSPLARAGRGRHRRRRRQPAQRLGRREQAVCAFEIPDTQSTRYATLKSGERATVSSTQFHRHRDLNAARLPLRRRLVLSGAAACPTRAHRSPRSFVPVPR